MSPTGAKGDLIYCVWCTTLIGSQLIELIPQGPLQARGRRTFPSRLVQTFAASVLLSPPFPKHQTPAPAAEGMWAARAVSSSNADSPAGWCCFRIKPMLWCQDGILPKPGCLEAAFVSGSAT